MPGLAVWIITFAVLDSLSILIRLTEAEVNSLNKKYRKWVGDLRSVTSGYQNEINKLVKKIIKDNDRAAKIITTLKGIFLNNNPTYRPERFDIFIASLEPFFKFQNPKKFSIVLIFFGNF